jgi:uncharacterized iron-regulated protein
VRLHCAFLVSLFCLACAKAEVSSSSPEPAPAAPPAPAASSTPADFGPWKAERFADHPLVGTAWSSSSSRALTRTELEQLVAEARFVLLGETHDHPDHHRLQGELILAILGAGQGPAVAYEQLDPAKQPEIDAFIARPDDDRTVEDFPVIVAWADSGWPAWDLYRPTFAPVIEAGLPILAAQFPRSQTKRFMTEGLAVIEAESVSRYALDQPLAAELQAAWLDEMFASHCELVPREQLAPMVEIQRVRDAIMADAMLRGAEERGQAVLVAGTGHTRNEGVPRLLRMAGVEDAEIVSVGFVAVDPERSEPGEYGEDFDVLVFTPGIEREDPCAAMREAAK